jgi:hypothetical protein
MAGIHISAFAGSCDGAVFLPVDRGTMATIHLMFSENRAIICKDWLRVSRRAYAWNEVEEVVFSVIVCGTETKQNSANGSNLLTRSQSLAVEVAVQTWIWYTPICFDGVLSTEYLQLFV